MIAKCSKCGTVFKASWHQSFVNLGPWRYLKCPSCGKSSLMRTGVKDPITWFPEGAPIQENHVISEEDQLKKRLEDSRYERP